MRTDDGGSELRVLGGLDATIGVSITGNGGVRKTQGGDLYLSAINTYTGETSIEAGTLHLKGAGAIADSSALRLASGAYLRAGEVTAGTISVGSLFGARGSTILLGATDMNVDQAVDGYVDGIMGTGTMNLSGAGMLTVDRGIVDLTRVNIAAGSTLRVGTGASGGNSLVMADINNAGTLIEERTDTSAYQHVLSGDGRFIIAGTGDTILTEDSGGYTGAVDIERGTLNLRQGAVLGSCLLTVHAPGMLRGAGEVRGDVHVAGRIAPGAFTHPNVPNGDNTLGSLSVTGDVVFDAGAILGVRIAGDGTNDSLAVAGSAALAGNVEVTAIDAATSYVDGHTYTILTAADGVTGTFADVTMAGGSAFLTPELLHSGADVRLKIAVTHDFTTAADTFNQRQAASGLFGLDKTPSSDSLAVFNQIAVMNTANARAASDLSSGEVHASGKQVIDQTFGLFNHMLRGHGVLGASGVKTGSNAPLFYGPSSGADNAALAAAAEAAEGYVAPTTTRSAWVTPLGGAGRMNGDGNAGAVRWAAGGFAAGYEDVAHIGGGTAVGGFGVGYMRSHASIDDRLSSHDADTFHVGAYGAWGEGPWRIAGALSYGASHISTSRDIAFVQRTAKARYWQHSLGLTGEASYGFDVGASTRLAPLVTLDAGWFGHRGFNETGADSLDLSGRAESWTRLDAGFGLALTHDVVTEAGRLSLDARVVWERGFGVQTPSQALAVAGSSTGFTVHGPVAATNRLRLGAGVSWKVSEGMSVRARYDGVLSSRQSHHAGSVGLNFRF